MTNNNKLTYLNCSRNQIMNLDLSKVPNLTNLECNANQIKTLDIRKNPVLTNINCTNNNFLKTICIPLNVLPKNTWLKDSNMSYSSTCK